VVVVLSILGFAPLLVMCIAAPLHAAESATPAVDPAGDTAAA